ncbi:hypothetical protein K432DRAFT_59584 [Lepidopterella palustris CBS 459.81]|uniref:Uncharacterized protein n=1 Tax=Lepidopterella palustris CBS 459.81 TaxID=1314670 RepID=A0A8E2E955_9PEZI|nr:hypothetical protein K432DRAFT_59584 [Lepidopterella palustris CBS 459.81]
MILEHVVLPDWTRLRLICLTYCDPLFRRHSTTQLCLHSTWVSYWLVRDINDQRRLDAQHALWTKALGYLLHPSFSKTSPVLPNCRHRHRHRHRNLPPRSP